MTTATLEAPALEFDFDTLGLDLLTLDAPDDQPGDPLACSNIDQGNEPAPPQSPESGPLFTDNQLFTIEDDEAPASLEAEPLSPLQLPASIPAAMEASLKAPASPSLESPEPDCAPGRGTPTAPAPCGFLTRRQELTEEINALESQVVEYSETEYELAEKVSQVRKWRKEALEQLRALKWQLNAMSDEDAEKPAFECAAEPVTSTTLFSMQTVQADSQAPADPTIDHGGAQSLTALGVTPKQLEKFEIEGIRTVSQFERALADRSIENVRGIQERTMDKLREALWEFRKQHPIPDPDDRPVLTASERDAKIEAAAGELQVEPEATEAPPDEETADTLTPELRDQIIQSGRRDRFEGKPIWANPMAGSSQFRQSLWEDGWREEHEAQQEIAKRLSAGARGEPSEAAGDSAEEKATKPARKPRAKKAKAEATESPDPFELYQTVKAKFPEYTLFIRTGDIYELFCEDAEKTAELFGLTLVVGKCGNSPPIPMIGFHARQLEEYEAKASEAGHKVHIFEPK